MSLPARVSTGVPAAGQYAPVPKSEPKLSLVASLPPSLPDRVEFAQQWPNRHQRLDRLNERWHAVASHAWTTGFERVAVVRAAVRETLDVAGRFVSLPEDDGEGASYVFDALRSDQKIDEALDRIGPLADHETRSFGNRLAGALYDIETEAVQTRLPAVDAPLAPSVGFDEWPSWLPTEAPEMHTTW